MFFKEVLREFRVEVFRTKKGGIFFEVPKKSILRVKFETDKNIGYHGFEVKIFEKRQFKKQEDFELING